MEKGLKILMVAGVCAMMFGANSCLAEEVLGTITTGIGATNGQSVSGVVVAPPPAGGGGGGGRTGGESQTGKIGDINSDNKVDEYDFALMMANWSATGANLQGDLNKDGKVNEYDFSILMLHWGE